jgi:predicted Zn-dependent protease with MMP-like domain
MRVSRDYFEELVFDIAEEVLGKLPLDLRVKAETVMLDIVDQPTEKQAAQGEELLGLYEGVPLVERGADDVFMQPDRITLFFEPLVALAHTEEELRHEIRVTLVHELGHFFGFDEDELAERGWE